MEISQRCVPKLTGHFRNTPLGWPFPLHGFPSPFQACQVYPQMKVFQSRALCSAANVVYYTPRKKPLAPPLPENCPKLPKSWEKQPVNMMPKCNSMGGIHSWTKLDQQQLHPGTLKRSWTLIYNGRQYLWNRMWLLESRDVYLCPQWFLNVVQIQHRQGRGAWCGQVCL